MSLRVSAPATRSSAGVGFVGRCKSPRNERLSGPWSDTRNPVDPDVSDIAGLSGFRRWELDIRSEIGASQTLQQGRGASFGDACRPVNDEILNETTIVMRPGLERYGDPIVVADVAHLAALRQMAGDDLVTLKADPDDRNLGAAIGIQCDKVSKCRGLEYGSHAFRDGGHS
jgi:hypothetical protein